MAGRVVRRRRAREDLVACAQRIAEDRPQTAIRFLDAVESTLQQLADFPELGQEREFVAKELSDIRSFPVSGFSTFLIFYYPIPEGIRFSRLLYGTRDIEAALQDE